MGHPQKGELVKIFSSFKMELRSAWGHVDTYDVKYTALSFHIILALPE